jgi:hypothetical protein
MQLLQSWKLRTAASSTKMLPSLLRRYGKTTRRRVTLVQIMKTPLWLHLHVSPPRRPPLLR